MNNSNQSLATINRRSRFGSGVGLACSLFLLVLPGVAVLDFAEKHKPTVANVFANAGDVLTPSAYQGVHAIGLLMLIGGGVLALVCVVRMASRSAAPSVLQHAPPSAWLREPAPVASPVRAFPPPAAEARQPTPSA